MSHHSVPSGRVALTIGLLGFLTSPGSGRGAGEAELIGEVLQRIEEPEDTARYRIGGGGMIKIAREEGASGLKRRRLPAGEGIDCLPPEVWEDPPEGPRERSICDRSFSGGIASRRKALML